MSIESVELNCPLCNSTSNSYLRKYRTQTPIFSQMSLFECDKCSIVFAGPLPEQGEIDAYNASYFENAHQGLKVDDPALRFFSGIAKVRIEHLMKYLGQKNTSIHRVLEVGPGHGYLCKHLLSRKPDLDYIVVESDESLHEHQRSLGAKVYANFSDVPSGLFDLVIATHVLEHVSEPVGFIETLNSLLVQGGTLFIEVPCRDFEFKEIDEPHLLFFDKPGMKFLFEKTGFEDLELSYHGREIADMLRDEEPRSDISSRLIRKASHIYSHYMLKAGLANKGPTYINDADTWAILKPFESHLEKDQPSWWLRALAHKAK